MEIDLDTPSPRPSPEGRESFEYDLLIIGGGIVGSGVARDAAMRGLKTLLVEQADFASGTSSRSSRLLHGGLRYLAQMRVGLVREASLEKMRLSKIAPHLCQPLPFVFPVWQGSGWSLWQLAIGVRIYDWLCGGRNLGKSKSLRISSTLELLPGLRSEDLLGSTRHFDALTNDARLVIDTLRSAVEGAGVGAGARVCNYTKFVSAKRVGDVWQCELRDERTGASSKVLAKCIVNAAGAWASKITHSGVKLRLTKGVHLVVPRTRLRKELSPHEAVVLTEGSRILFIIPWGERIILGTTDTDYQGDPAAVRTEPQDVEYVLRVVNAAFPAAKLTASDVISTWAGVRPLVAPKNIKQGSPSDISRSHIIEMPEPGWFDVAGGKLTTYRHMAEQTIDRVGSFLQLKLPKSTTAEVPLVAGKFSGITPPELKAEVVAESCRHEWAVHLEDVLLRRTSWHYYHANHDEVAEQVATWMAEELKWTAAKKAAELERYRQTADSFTRPV